jgi:hypothetical protein
MLHLKKIKPTHAKYKNIKTKGQLGVGIVHAVYKKYEPIRHRFAAYM